MLGMAVYSSFLNWDIGMCRQRGVRLVVHGSAVRMLGGAIRSAVGRFARRSARGARPAVTAADVRVPMRTFEARVSIRDGVRLATDVNLTPGDVPRPALIQRTPYGKDAPLLISLAFEVAEATARGYAVVVQDCRGCGGSDGEFHALVGERADGHDMIEGVAAQPWCDGRAGSTARRTWA